MLFMSVVRRIGSARIALLAIVALASRSFAQLCERQPDLTTPRPVRFGIETGAGFVAMRRGLADSITVGVASFEDLPVAGTPRAAWMGFSVCRSTAMSWLRSTTRRVGSDSSVTRSRPRTTATRGD
jgi:hypothetical protein